MRLSYDHVDLITTQCLLGLIYKVFYWLRSLLFPTWNVLNYTLHQPLKPSGSWLNGKEGLILVLLVSQFVILIFTLVMLLYQSNQGILCRVQPFKIFTVASFISDVSEFLIELPIRELYQSETLGLHAWCIKTW